MLSNDALLAHQRLNTDLEFFAANAPMMVKDKEGNLVVWRFTRAQRYLHNRAEDMWKRKGFVRLLVMKGRQLGISTYVEGRYYHKASRNKGKSVFVLSHDGSATHKLFRMVKRFQENVREEIRPAEGVSNRMELVFSGMGSDYGVGTAGSENVGRGGTAQYFHWSEVAYSENAEEIQDGALESIALMGTEIILESTANGPLGLFYGKCMDALKGVGDYELVFLPWYWQEEYERDAVSVLTAEETEYANNYLKEYPKEKGLRKMAWRRAKIIEFCNGRPFEIGVRKFRQIYPANPVEAFQSSGIGLIDPGAIMSARKNIGLMDDGAPLIMGVDSAGGGEGSDRSVIAFRRGRVLEEVMKIPKQPNMDMAVAGVCMQQIDRRHAEMCFMDVTYGHGSIDRMHELRYNSKVMGVCFGEGAMRPDVYLNKRAEMIIEASEWVNKGGVRIPDDDEVHADFAAMPIYNETSNSVKYMPSKKDIKKLLGGRSPDIYDAFALTFAYPVRRTDNTTMFRKKSEGGVDLRRNGRGQSPLSSMRRMRGRG
jgi:hypothetical protein